MSSETSPLADVVAVGALEMYLVRENPFGGSILMELYVEKTEVPGRFGVSVREHFSLDNEDHVLVSLMDCKPPRGETLRDFRRNLEERLDRGLMDYYRAHLSAPPLGPHHKNPSSNEDDDFHSDCR